MDGSPGSHDEEPARFDLGIAGCEDAVEVGRGGFGVVYRARQPQFNRLVAIKVIGAKLDETSRSRFEREIQTMGTLSGHANIVTIYHADFTSEGIPYIVMEYEAQGSLAERLERSGPLPWEEAVTVGIGIAGAIAAAHDAGVLHRDIKPENILVSAFGEYKLADFGIARMEGAAHTRTGVVTASLAHAAPEILAGQRPSVATDIYALGSTVFALVRGMPAFVVATDESLVPLLARVSSQPVPDLRPSGVPDVVCRALERAMAKEPGRRQASADDLRRELERALQAGTLHSGADEAGPTVRRAPSEAPPPEAPSPGRLGARARAAGPAATHRRRVSIPLAAAAIVAVVGIAGVALYLVVHQGGRALDLDRALLTKATLTPITADDSSSDAATLGDGACKAVSSDPGIDTSGQTDKRAVVFQGSGDFGGVTYENVVASFGGQSDADSFLDRVAGDGCVADSFSTSKDPHLGDNSLHVRFQDSGGRGVDAFYLRIGSVVSLIVGSKDGGFPSGDEVSKLATTSETQLRHAGG